MKFTLHRLSYNCSLPELHRWDGFPKLLQFALMTMDRVILNVVWVWYCDPRANIIETQSGYRVRS